MVVKGFGELFAWHGVYGGIKKKPIESLLC